MLKQIASFLLCAPPLDELTDELASVAENYRFNMLTEKQALDILLNEHEDVLQQYLNRNLDLNGLT